MAETGGHKSIKLFKEWRKNLTDTELANFICGATWNEKLEEAPSAPNQTLMCTTYI